MSGEEFGDNSPRISNKNQDFFSEDNSVETGKFTSEFESPYYLNVESNGAMEMELHRENSSLSGNYLNFSSILLITFSVILFAGVMINGVDHSPNDRVKVLAVNSTNSTLPLKRGNLTKKTRLNKFSDQPPLQSKGPSVRNDIYTNSTKLLPSYYKYLLKSNDNDNLPVIYTKTHSYTNGQKESNRIYCQDCYFNSQSNNLQLSETDILKFVIPKKSFKSLLNSSLDQKTSLAPLFNNLKNLQDFHGQAPRLDSEEEDTFYQLTCKIKGIEDLGRM